MNTRGTTEIFCTSSPYLADAYLTQWRMLLAANLLCRSNATLTRIAEDVGYQTDTDFSPAFRREYGAPPATWRRSHGVRERMH